MRKKTGITIVSLIVYVVLLASITGIAAMVSTSFNGNVLEEKGETAGLANILQVIYEVNESAKNSYNLTITTEGNNTTFIFSNGDKFEFNDTLKVLYKNGGVICDNITYFLLFNNITGTSSHYSLYLKTNKYNSVIEREIRFSIGA